MTQAELADELDVSRQMVTRYESGRDLPAVEVLAAAARVLDTKFSVQGMIVTSGGEFRGGPRPVAQQLVLPFMRTRKFRRAVVEITRRKGKILISATLPA